MELTGEGCGYKQEHSLSREEREALRQNTGNIRLVNIVCNSYRKHLELIFLSIMINNIVLCFPLLVKSEMSPVNPPSEQLNQGGSHLRTAELNGGDGQIGGILEFISINCY